MKSISFVLFVILLFVLSLNTGCTLLGYDRGLHEVTIATWNIRFLSDGSRDDHELAGIANIIERYDFVAIQEARDTVVLDRLQTRLPGYGYLSSKPVGESVTEIYAFFYKTNLFAVLGTPYLYNDRADEFIREPFIASFRAGDFDFTLINIHVLYGTLAERRAEIRLLDDVISIADEHNGNENDVILLGDFNVDRDDEAWQISTHSAIVPATTPTTIAGTSSYDNFWINTGATTEYDAPVEVYRFDELLYGDDDDTASLEVSDHRPVVVRFVVDGSDDDAVGVYSGFHDTRIPSAAVQPRTCVVCSVLGVIMHGS